MAKDREKSKRKKHGKSEEKEIRNVVKEKKISKKHKRKFEEPDIPDKSSKREKKSKKSKKWKKKHKEREISPEPEPEIAAVCNTPSPPIATDEPDSGSECEPEDLRQLLESYSKEDLVDLICKKADKGSRLISSVLKSADLDIDQRNIFVRGLGYDTTRENLEAAFESYGKIEECNVVMDKDTGKAKGYGFILFKTRKGARKALKFPHKKMFNRTVICNLASERPSGVGKGREIVEQVKIDLTQMPNNHSEVSGLELAYGHAVNNPPQHHAGPAVFAGQSMPFYGQPPGFNPMYGAMMGNQMVAGVPNYAVFSSGMMNQGLMVPPNHVNTVGQYAADGGDGVERAWYLR